MLCLCLCCVNNFAPILMRICIALAATLLLTTPLRKIAWSSWQGGRAAVPQRQHHSLWKEVHTNSGAYLHCFSGHSLAYKPYAMLCLCYVNHFAPIKPCIFLVKTTIYCNTTLGRQNVWKYKGHATRVYWKDQGWRVFIMKTTVRTQALRWKTMPFREQDRSCGFLAWKRFELNRPLPREGIRKPYISKSKNGRAKFGRGSVLS